MFITINNKPINVLNILFYYSENNKIFYRLDNGQVLEEEFSTEQDLNATLNKIASIKVSFIAENGSSTDTVTTIDSSSTDTQCPSAKAVYDLFTSITDADNIEY